MIQRTVKVVRGVRVDRETTRGLWGHPRRDSEDVSGENLSDFHGYLLSAAPPSPLARPERASNLVLVFEKTFVRDVGLRLRRLVLFTLKSGDKGVYILPVLLSRV